MPIGGRNPENEPGTVQTGGAGGAGVPWAPPSSGAITPQLATRWLRRFVTPVDTYVPSFQQTLPVATLQPPGPGQQYLLENVLLGLGGNFLTGDMGQVIIAVGTAGTAGQPDMIDVVGPLPVPSVSNSYASPLRVGPQESLLLIWTIQAPVLLGPLCAQLQLAVVPS